MQPSTPSTPIVGASTARAVTVPQRLPGTGRMRIAMKPGARVDLRASRQLDCTCERPSVPCARRVNRAAPWPLALPSCVCGWCPRGSRPRPPAWQAAGHTTRRTSAGAAASARGRPFASARTAPACRAAGPRAASCSACSAGRRSSHHRRGGEWRRCPACRPRAPTRPNQVPWNGLKLLGICQFPGSQAEYQRSPDPASGGGYPSAQRRRRGGGRRGASLARRLAAATTHLVPALVHNSIEG